MRRCGNRDPRHLYRERERKSADRSFAGSTGIRYNKKRYAVRESGGLYLRRCGREIVKKSGGGQR